MILQTPVALLLSGAFLARSDLPAALRKPEVWRVTLWRLVLIPLGILLLFRFLILRLFVHGFLNLWFRFRLGLRFRFIFALDNRIFGLDLSIGGN